MSGQVLRWLFDGDRCALLALRRRAERHFRSPLGELRSIVYEALEPEIEAVKAELAAELPDEPAERKEVSLP